MYAPVVIIILVVVAFPTAFLFYTSLFVREILYNRIYFVGLGNFIKIFHSQSFLTYLGHTGVYAFGTLAVIMPLSIGLALALDQIERFKTLFLTSLLIPWMIPPAASGILWKWVLGKMFGILNVLLVDIGILNEHYHWLGKIPSAMIWLIIIRSWYDAPFVIVLIYSGLQRLPQTLEDAIDLDGANSWQKFWYLTLPFIKTEILFALSIKTIFLLRAFPFVWIVTGGGPSDNTEVVSTSIYRMGQVFLRQGYASTMSVSLLLITVGIIILYFKFIKIEK